MAKQKYSTAAATATAAATSAAAMTRDATGPSVSLMAHVMKDALDRMAILTYLRPYLQARGQKARLLAFNLELLRDVIFALFVLRWTRKSWVALRGRGIVGTARAALASVRRALYGAFLRAPGVRSQVQRQVAASMAKLEARLVPQGLGVTRYLTLPKEGWTAAQVRAELDKLADMEHARWEDGMVSGAVYHGGHELLQLQADAYAKFAVANPIHPDVFPGVRKMEAEVVAMVLALFNAPPDSAGLMTSGGTESIIMACYSARQKAYVERGVTEPEMILPETAHAAFRKACSYLCIRAHIVACPAPDYKVSIPDVARLINSNTVLLVGSAPNFPHGIIDDIAALSQLALDGPPSLLGGRRRRRRAASQLPQQASLAQLHAPAPLQQQPHRDSIPLHVDCCLGSFVIAFLERAGLESAPFDFRLPGVTSISCDTHKYGFAPKGTATLLYRSAALRAHQYFVSADWPGGVYPSPGLAGSRPGALSAACWASLMAQGESGYTAACAQLVGATRRIAAALREQPVLAAELAVLGRPLVSVLAFRSVAGLDIYAVADGMAARGWHLNALQAPPAIHVAVTVLVAAAVDRLVADLVAVVGEERRREEARRAGAEVGGSSSSAVGIAGASSSSSSSTGAATESMGDAAALYGVAGSLPNKSVVVDLAKGYLDILYKA